MLYNHAESCDDSKYNRAEVPEDPVPRPPGEGGADPSADDLHFTYRKTGKLSKLQYLTQATSLGSQYSLSVCPSYQRRSADNEF